MLALKVLLALIALLLVAAAVQVGRSSADEAEAERAWRELANSHLPLPARYDPGLVAGLPEPARRYFNFVLRPGARLGNVVEIEMTGRIALGTKAQPDEQPLRARQVLAAPHGMVWRLQAGRGAMSFAGSDGLWGERSWTRFWLLRLVPVVREGGSADHRRSAFGRTVAESAIWAPAFLLPREGIDWTAVDADTARVVVSHGGLSQAVDIRVDARGQPQWVSMPRWTNANADKVFRVQPFGGEVSDFREVDGQRLPFRVDGGNFFGTPAYFPFYRVQVTRLRVLHGDAPGDRTPP